MNAVQHATQPMIQSTQKSLKIVSQFKNFEHKDLQNTHTHTQQVSPILYFKNKSRQFSEYTLTHVNLCDGQITLYMHMYQE